ncbi:MAG: hypothetical protein GF400_04860 [Candidatus Eisenbacteria bacterium]|nr:hypothetical protein [Candidatus Eisenbacteria bacterium]
MSRPGARRSPGRTSTSGRRSERPSAPGTPNSGEDSVRAKGLVLGFVLILLQACGCAPAVGSASGSDADAPADAASPLRQVTFVFSPERSFDHVFLAGTFNDWSTDATEMRREDGRFEVVLPLPAGRYQYKFVADGQWITDEKAEAFHPDGYGGRNSVVLVDSSFPAVSIERGDGEIMVDGLAHRQDAWERSLDPDGGVTLRVRAWANDVERVDFIIRGVAEPAGTALRPLDSDGTHDYFETTLAPELVSAEAEYAFRFVDADVSVLLGEDGTTTGEQAIRWFDLDVSSLSTFETPDWIKEGVIYQIFPERFANGDEANDPDFSEWYYEGVRELPPSGKSNGEYFHLVEDWYDVAGLSRSPYKTDGKPDWNSFYGGDIEGIRENLDYLTDLGVTVIYLNPIFKSKSNHKYDAATYMEVDPHFGTNEEFKAFVDECHEREIRVVIDLAINHTGHTHWAFVDARKNGPRSPYWDWYEWNDWPVPGDIAYAPPNPLDYYDCWWGFGQMPNLNFDLSRPNNEEHAVAEMEAAAPNEPLVEHLLDVAEYWLAEIGVDGYRLDVAGEVPFWFWELFRERVRSTKPDAYIVGELWGASPEWVNGDYFDAVMNYKYFREPVMRFLCRGEIDAAEFDRALAPGRLIYPEEGVLAQMNLLGSHDTERFVTAAGGDERRLRLAALFMMTYVGAPTIYYGDEIAMRGGGDPDCRRPFDWRWTEDGEQARTRNLFARLASLRGRFPMLVYGDFETLVTGGRVYSYRRRDDRSEVVVVLNASEEEADVAVPLGRDIYSGAVGDGYRRFDSMIDLSDGSRTPVYEKADEMLFNVTLPPLTGSLYTPHMTTTTEGTGTD